MTPALSLLALTITVCIVHSEASVRNLTDVRIDSDVTADLGDNWKAIELYLIDCRDHGRKFSQHMQMGPTHRQKARHGNCKQKVRCAEFVPGVVTFPRLHYEQIPPTRTHHFYGCNCLPIKYPFSYLKKVGNHWEMQIKAILVGQRCNKNPTCRRYEC